MVAFEGLFRALIDASTSVLSASGEPRAVEPLNAINEILEASLSASRPVPAAHDRLRVALVGRTKAGKSQLVAALTGDDQGVGVGRQRTTREVREYRLDDFDLIDTPGVAALDGEVDTERALEAADQADAVLWVYTESLQDAEADTLATLLFHGKPVIVAFNVKWALDLPAKRRIFEKRPARFLDRHLDGHRTRIEQVAARAEARTPDLVTYHGRAAWWARQEDSATLRAASRIDDLLDACHRTLVPRAESLRIQRDHDAIRHRLVDLTEVIRQVGAIDRPNRTSLRGHLVTEADILLEAVEAAYRTASTRLDASAARSRRDLDGWLRSNAKASESAMSESWSTFLGALLESIDVFAEQVAAETSRHGRLFSVAEKMRDRLGRRRHRPAPGRGWRSRLRSVLRVAGNAAVSFAKGLAVAAGLRKVLAKFASRAVPGAGWGLVAVDAAKAISAETRREVERHAAERQRWHDTTVDELEHELTWVVSRVRRSLREARTQVERDIRAHRDNAAAVLDRTDIVLQTLEDVGSELDLAIAETDLDLVASLLQVAGRDVNVVAVERQPGSQLSVSATGTDADLELALITLQRHFINETVELAATAGTEEMHP